MKKIIIISIVGLIIFLIYLTAADKKIYYVALGDELSLNINNNNYSQTISEYLTANNKLEIFVNQFSKDNYHITDIINDIKNNKKININNKSKTIKNALIKADLLTLSIGINDITSKINIKNLNLSNDYNFLYDDIDEIVSDLDILLNLLRQYCKEDIMLVGIYYPFKIQNNDLADIFLYANNKFKETTKKYNINYIDIHNLFIENSEYLTENIYPSVEGYNIIAEQIIVTINNTLLKNS